VCGFTYAGVGEDLGIVPGWTQGQVLRRVGVFPLLLRWDAALLLLQLLLLLLLLLLLSLLLSFHTVL
jgi:hypothetical protein